jgi:hypothetical protein
MIRNLISIINICIICLRKININSTTNTFNTKNFLKTQIKSIIVIIYKLKTIFTIPIRNA